MIKLLTPLLAISMSVSTYATEQEASKLLMPIGETQYISAGLGDSKLKFLSRIDTGANVTSIHAIDVHIDDAVEDMRANMGKMITFTTVNERGDEIRISSPIVKVSTIRNAQGSEQRYSVRIDVRNGDDVRTVDATLRDRSNMSTKLLIGRNWLRDHYTVDVSFDAHATTASEI
ncbi:exported hypothetical protein [Vibrio chagasii]|nr:exported hypothetical protein [Vibrio chagasii]